MFGKVTSRMVCGGLILVATWLVAYAGWRGRILSVDLIPSANAAIEFVQTGKIPQKGCLSSTCGYIPPGTSWLLLPGIIMFRDPRLFEAPGTLVLHGLTIAGLILMGALLGTAEVGVAAAALYSVGSGGLFFASSLWPRSHPALCVWTLAFLLLYLRSRRSYYFGLAILTFGVGLLVFLEMAPMGIAFPLAIVFGPRGRRLAAYIAGSVILVVAIWSPYLRFEGMRDYEDLKRLVVRENCPIVAVSSYNWCSPSRAPIYETVTNHLVTSALLSPEAQVPGSMLRRSVARLIGNLSPSFAINWRERDSVTGRVFSGPGFVFLTALRSVIFVLGLTTVFKRGAWKWMVGPNWQTSRRLVLLTGMSGVLVGGALHPRFIGLFARSGTYYDLIRTYSGEAFWLGILLLAIWGSLVARGWKDGPELTSASPTGYQLLIATYVVSWLFWALVGGDPRYFYWLWPMQALIMAMGIGFCLAIFCGSRVHPWNRWVSLALVVALIAANGSFVSQLSGWAKLSWSGQDDPIIASLDQIAEERRLAPAHTVRVVYETASRDFVLPVGTLDPVYLPGMQYDFYLREKYGLENEVQCVGVPTNPPDYVIRDDQRQSKSAIGEYIWFDMDSEVAKNMRVATRRGSIALLARAEPATSGAIK
jgi:hypothetical protein